MFFIPTLCYSRGLRWDYLCSTGSRYLLTRYEPTDAPQNRIVAFLRTMYAEKVLNAPMLKSTAISDAGLTKQTLYEVDRSAFTRATYDRALESLNAVNDEIAALIQKTWGR